MRRYKETKIEIFFKGVYKNYLPNKSDNLKQISLKTVFLLLIAGILVSGIYFGSYYHHNTKQEKLLEASREIFNSGDCEESYSQLIQQNSDYKAWLKLGDTKLNNPVFKARDNRFYLNRNGIKEESSYGALFLDYRCETGDKNLIVYGNSLENGSMFGTLEKLRTLSFYKQNSLLSFTTSKGETDYKIYAVFVLNAAKEDDGGYIYNIYRNEFYGEEDFNNWVNEAKIRSVINTGIDVNIQDNILTLVTSCDDFENARLVVMARSERVGETLSSDSLTATVNAKPRYPKKWYQDRSIEYPF